MSKVLSLSKSQHHTFSKVCCPSITLIEDQGVAGDAHCGNQVQHRSRVKVDPTAANLRQVHLIHSELLSQLQAKGFNVQPATLGENITTSDIDLLSLPRDTELSIGQTAVIRITGLRNPCSQLDKYQMGLIAAVLAKDSTGKLIRKAGVMGVILKGGVINTGDAISIQLPHAPHYPLERV